jgi:DNA-directed RNA polymerase specialized sigma24 family protein
MTIFPIAVLLQVSARIVRAVDDGYTATRGNWAPANRPVRLPAGAHTGRNATRYGKRVALVRPVGSDLIARALAGDGAAFHELTEPHRRELQVHCYRMLGSFQDAEDAVQDTMLAAWRGLGGFSEDRASLRTWLYKIATNRCLNALRSARRRGAKEWDVPNVEPPEPTRLGEVVWLQPYPDDLLADVADARLDAADALRI